MRLVVGLGNPGREYEATRHNAGFWWVENLADAQRLSLRTEARFHGQVGRVSAAGHDCWLLLPQTYIDVLPVNGPEAAAKVYEQLGYGQ